MKLFSRRSVCAALAAGACGMASAYAATEVAYPAKPIKLVVPFPAAGTADVIARLVGNKMGEQLGQPVIVDNRAGANGNIGTEAVARAPADGYTVLLGSTPNMVINPALYAHLPFDTLKDFIPVLALGSSPNLLVVNPSLQVLTVREFIALSKSGRSPIRFASGGNGSTGHLAMEMFKSAAGLDFIHVPYRGGPPAINDLIGGQVDALFFPAPAVFQHVLSGKLKALAVASPQRTSVMPEVPTFSEAGLRGFDASPWFGLFVPKGTPIPMVNKLRTAAQKALGEVSKQLTAQGIEPMTESGDAFARLVKADLVRWAEAGRKSGAKID